MAEPQPSEPADLQSPDAQPAQVQPAEAEPSERLETGWFANTAIDDTVTRQFVVADGEWMERARWPPVSHRCEPTILSRSTTTRRTSS